MEEDERLKPILLNVEKQYVGMSYNSGPTVEGAMQAKDVDIVSGGVSEG